MGVAGGVGSIDAFLGNGDGTFQPSKSLTQAGVIYSMVSGDFDGDCKPDLVTGCAADVCTFLNASF